jgi:hypothetical protein
VCVRIENRDNGVGSGFLFLASLSEVSEPRFVRRDKFGIRSDIWMEFSLNLSQITFILVSKRKTQPKMAIFQEINPIKKRPKFWRHILRLI